MGPIAVHRLRMAALRHPQLLDAVLGCVLVAPAVRAVATGVPPPMVERSFDGGGLTAIVLAFLAITVRRLWPLPLLVVTGTVTFGYVLATRSHEPVLTVASVVLAYTVASRTDRRTAWLAAGTVALALYTAGLRSPSSWWEPANVGVLAWFGMATAVGDAVRSRRAYVAEVEQRARHAEQTRDDEARRRVVEERMRIARELHDVVSHHIAVISVQAGAAGHVLARQPAAAAESLEHIRRAADTVLRELSAVVGVLRQAGDGDLGTAPTRGLAGLADLLDTLAATGLCVEHKLVGAPRHLPAVVDLAAYRIVQEALTNAHKHGTGTATLTITYTNTGVTIHVANPVAERRIGAGYGIVGMRERAASAGGTLAAHAEPDGWFTVHATLPAPDEREYP